MKLAIERADLHAALGRVAKIVEARSTIPILSFLRLSAQDGALTITGTDLDVEATTIAPADVGAAGEATVAAREFASIVTKLGAGAQVELEAADGKIVVKAARARFTLATLPVEDYHRATPAARSPSFSRSRRRLMTSESLPVAERQDIIVPIVGGQIVAEGGIVYLEIGPLSLSLSLEDAEETAAALETVLRRMRGEDEP
ncbi:hypothetical protein [Methylocella sp.]|uniref:hypothetical protein n=1 Tax=Methylocella sp. TaxID=1978226 RepID=UPI0035B46E47